MKKTLKTKLAVHINSVYDHDYIATTYERVEMLQTANPTVQ